MADFKSNHWALLDLKYEYLDDGFKLTAYTDVPCHLFCRMTTTPPRKHELPGYRRGTYLQGEMRFCFVVYEDNEQDEPGDTLIHTFMKASWPICQTRWFYFVGTQGGAPSVSETAIFKFHFPAPPPEPPDPMLRLFIAGSDNRTVYRTGAYWPTIHDSATGTIHTTWDTPTYRIYGGDRLTASYWIMRGFLSFDTSIIPETAIITEATLYIYVWLALADFIAFPNLFVTQGVQHVPVIPADYGGQLPYTAVLGATNMNDLIVGQYNAIPLEPWSFPLINKSGLTKLCTRGQRDVQNILYAFVSTNWTWFASYQRGLGYYPYLEIKYYPA